jgi:hypothetical protein
VNRPDPENREFTHPDPLAWTQCNRTRILRALYTVLIAGALNRPQHQAGKTRFKTWWRLVGWPVEYAASSIGITLDCADLLRAGEVGDEEAAAVSLTLSLFRELWDDGRFTAKDVVKAIAPKPDGSLDERAEAIAGALGELVGKRLDRPTAHSLGKLFQKRLVDRPAWIDDGQRVGTLKKIAGHNENSYRVDIAAPGQACDLPSSNAVADTQKNIPHIPQIPQIGRLEEGRGGIQGKDGNVSVDGAVENSLVSDHQNNERLGWSARL